ncbi:MAG TPA: hypothetical protein VFK69_11645 [Candidatus Eisenbacteria bacterium]|nr:hypothetical protein [Candidatus Eisenbacteria bacterium]
MRGAGGRRAAGGLGRWASALAVLGACGLVLALPGQGPFARWRFALGILETLRAPGPRSWLDQHTPAPTRTTTVLRADGRRLVADVYRPGGAASPYPVLFVPGMVEGGKDDPRVRPFAELLARAGWVTVVPDLPSFRALQVSADNVRDMDHALDALLARRDLAPRGQAGVFAVSYAGGIALLSALEPRRAPAVRFMTLVGAYSDLDSTLVYLATGRVFEHGRSRMSPRSPYGQLVFVRTFEAFVPRARDRALLEAMVARRMKNFHAPVADLARRLHPDARLIYDLFEGAPRDSVPALAARLPKPLRARMAALSPDRHDFSPLHARMYLAHAHDDGTFPTSQAEQLAALARPHVPVRLVVLTALDHVEPEPWHHGLGKFLTRDVPEAMRLTMWWAELLKER